MRCFARPCGFYESAAQACETAGSEQGALCAAVDEAMDADRFPPGDDEDSTRAFLVAVRDKLKGPLSVVFTRMIDKHDALEHELSSERRRAREAAQRYDAAQSAS